MLAIINNQEQFLKSKYVETRKLTTHHNMSVTPRRQLR